MSACLTLLDRALILAQHELDALRNGDVERAETHFDERFQLLNQAATTNDELEPEDYYVKLMALQGYNAMIRDEGRELLESIRVQLVQVKGNSRRIKGYTRAMLQ